MHYVKFDSIYVLGPAKSFAEFESIGKSWIHAQTQGTDQYFVLK
jgi:hypothetical protein